MIRGDEQPAAGRIGADISTAPSSDLPTLNGSEMAMLLDNIPGAKERIEAGIDDARQDRAHSPQMRDPAAEADGTWKWRLGIRITVSTCSSDPMPT
jgi:hypothetical protein